MKIIVLERDDKIIVTDEDQLTKEFHEQYEKNGNGMDKDYFYYEFFYCEPINGTINYLAKDDRINFQYNNWDVEQTYDHIETCLEWLREKSRFDKYTMFHVLMALNSCGAIGKREYKALDEKYCTYSK